MKSPRSNHYERAFGNWLRDNHVQYIAVDEKKRTQLERSKIKSFDYLLYPPAGQIYIAEVKGRKYKGTSLENLAGFQTWVTAQDIEGLAQWQKILGPPHLALLVFAYLIEKIDVDFDGTPCYEFAARRYIFFAVTLDDYCKFMKLRSPKWQTVTMPAQNFRNCAKDLRTLLR